MQDDRSQVIRFILEALADDYESIETLVNYYTEPQPDKPSFSRADVIQALTELMARGYVQACTYSESDQKLMPSEFFPARADIYWFRLTKMGKEFLPQLTKREKGTRGGAEE